MALPASFQARVREGQGRRNADVDRSASPPPGPSATGGGNSGWFSEELDGCQLDIFFLEALINGLLLAGLLALLALGLNLVFGVIDVVWICYAELVMVGMYGINYAYKGGVPFLLAALFGIVLVAIAARCCTSSSSGRCWTRRRSTSCSSPAACCSCCRPPPRWRSASSSEHRPPPRLVQRSPTWFRLGAHHHLRGRARRHAGALAVPDATYIGTAIRAISQDRQIMPLMGVDSRKLYLVTSAIGGGLAGLAAA